jgi:uncharacterized protein YfaS (alpha-2-macroglobulin family)
MKVLFRLFWCVAGMGFLKSTAQEIKPHTKQLTVAVAMPRFLYEGDRLEVAATITNKTGHELTGQATLQLLDAANKTSVDGWFQNVFPTQYFTVAAGGSETTLFPIEVPYLFKKTVRLQVVAHTENGADSTTILIPVLTNKTLITETRLLPIKNGVQHFSFESLLRAGPATEYHSLIFELFQNPMWHVAQALPWLAEAEDENATAAWNRFYAAAVAQKISASLPDMKQVIKGWKNSDTTAFQSYLQKQKNLRSLLQQETPWVLYTTRDEKYRIAALFDTAALQEAQKSSLQKLKKTQNSNGSFSLFAGGPEDRFITQSIVAGMGSLKSLEAFTNILKGAITAVLKPTLSYLDQQIAEDYTALLKQKKDLKRKQIHPEQIQYLYLRSFFTDVAVPAAVLPAYRFYQQQAKHFWNRENHALQAMVALALHRSSDTKTPAIILASLKKTGTGTAQKTQAVVLHWWQDEVVGKTVLIEAFNEIKRDTPVVAALQTALLSGKGANSWQTATSTAAACYALLLQPGLLGNKANVHIRAGNVTFSNAGKRNSPEAGFFKEIIEAPHIKPDIGTIQMTAEEGMQPTATQTPATAVAYWSYFQNNPVAAPATGIKIRKQAFVKRAGRSEPVSETTHLHIADTVAVRLSITSKHKLNYIKIQDRHAGALKPVGGSTNYRMPGRSGWHLVHQPAGTAFFLPVLQSGTSVLEYPLLVTHAGTFGTGIATVQRLYAPGFLAYSEALRIQVE